MKKISLLFLLFLIVTDSNMLTLSTTTQRNYQRQNDLVEKLLNVLYRVKNEQRKAASLSKFGTSSQNLSIYDFYQKEKINYLLNLLESVQNDHQKAKIIAQRTLSASTPLKSTEKSPQERARAMSKKRAESQKNAQADKVADQQAAKKKMIAKTIQSNFRTKKEQAKIKAANRAKEQAEKERLAAQRIQIKWIEKQANKRAQTSRSKSQEARKAADDAKKLDDKIRADNLETNEIIAESNKNRKKAIEREKLIQNQKYAERLLSKAKKARKELKKSLNSSDDNIFRNDQSFEIWDNEEEHRKAPTTIQDAYRSSLEKKQNEKIANKALTDASDLVKNAENDFNSIQKNQDLDKNNENQQSLLNQASYSLDQAQTALENMKQSVDATEILEEQERIETETNKVSELVKAILENINILTQNESATKIQTQKAKELKAAQEEAERERLAQEQAEKEKLVAQQKQEEAKKKAEEEAEKERLAKEQRAADKLRLAKEEEIAQRLGIPQEIVTVKETIIEPGDNLPKADQFTENPTVVYGTLEGKPPLSPQETFKNLNNLFILDSNDDDSDDEDDDNDKHGWEID
jgi:unconventional prefoldin RPB5 interactor 1